MGVLRRAVGCHGGVDGCTEKDITSQKLVSMHFEMKSEL